MEAKVFNDPIHGQVKVHPLCIKIIDTPEFQRLRRIKQLGGVYHVYYGASHNRFEHSIGVCHLAGKLLRHLQSDQPELHIDFRDILCVEIAGLCHDLGHGPFSHLWDRSILRRLNKPEWKHEHGSVAMFDQLVEKNKLKTEFKSHLKIENDKDLDNELTFIKELIIGEKTRKSGSWEMKGRPESKAFLYEVISNSVNGIDVDKWDYFARDCYYLGLPKSFDHQRLMSFARVLSIPKDEHNLQICYRDKEASNVYGMFYTRSLLHQKAYQHKTVKAIEHMLTDAIVCASTLLKFKGENCSLKTLDKTADDMEAYAKVDDEVIGHIMKMSPEDLKSDAANIGNLKKAQEILKRIEKRQIYRCRTSDPVDSKSLKGFDIKKATEKLIQMFKEKSMDDITDEDFSLELITYDYGMKDENPVDKVYFYRKSDHNTPIKIYEHEVSMMLPKTFSETRILLLYKKFTSEEESDKELFEKVTGCFKKYCEEYCKPLTKPEDSEAQ